LKKTAPITSISGEDCANQAEFPLHDGYAVHGVKRHSSLLSRDRIDHLYKDPHTADRGFDFHCGDLTDSSGQARIFRQTQPDEVGAGALCCHLSRFRGHRTERERRMAARVQAGAQSNTVKYRCGVRNWPEYDRALVNRSSLTVWFGEQSFAESRTPPRPKGRGRTGADSGLAIRTRLTIKTLLRQTYRLTDGLMKSLMEFNWLTLSVPDRTHMSRPVASLAVSIPCRPRKGSIHVVVDSTGMKVFGEGEWKARQSRVSSAKRSATAHTTQPTPMSPLPDSVWTGRIAPAA
jgi:hypothetical protein